MKNEFGGKIMIEFVVLRAKTYSYLIDDGSEDKKVKGRKKCIIKRRLKFENLKICLRATYLENKTNRLEKIKTDIDGFLSFAKYVGKNVGKNMSKKLSSKYSKKLVEHAKQSTTDTLKTFWKRVIQKTAQVTGDLIGNKVFDTAARSYDGKITKVSKT